MLWVGLESASMLWVGIGCPCKALMAARGGKPAFLLQFGTSRHFPRRVALLCSRRTRPPPWVSSKGRAPRRRAVACGAKIVVHSMAIFVRRRSVFWYSGWYL